MSAEKEYEAFSLCQQHSSRITRIMMHVKKKILLLSLLICVSVDASSTQLMNELKALNSEQKKVLHDTFSKGDKFDLGLTMSAIAWEESQFGMIPINLSDPSCGVFHNLLSSVASRNNMRLNGYTKNKLCIRLISDYDFGFAEGLSELLYWKNYWKDKKVSNTWSRMVSSYNAGWKYKNGVRYLKKIRAKVRALKLYMKTNL